MARGLERGDIWLHRFGRPDKQRPVLVLSNAFAIRHLRTTIVAPITSTIRGNVTEVEVGVEHGLKGASVVQLDHIVTVPQSELRRYVGHVGPDVMERVCEAAAIALGCF